MMRRYLFVFGVVVTLITGCKKEDTTPPTITVNGSSPAFVSLNSDYVDAGATVTDNEDKLVNISSTLSSLNPNTDKTGSYTIVYSAEDKAGNRTEAERIVIVKNDAEFLQNTYSVIDSANDQLNSTYSEQITFHQTINNRILFSKFAGYSGNDKIFAEVQSGGIISIPLQSGKNIGPNSEIRQFKGSGVINGNDLVISFTDTDGAGKKVNKVAYYTKQ